jgi:hypothetical protein
MSDSQQTNSSEMDREVPIGTSENEEHDTDQEMTSKVAKVTDYIEGEVLDSDAGKYSDKRSD